MAFSPSTKLSGPLSRHGSGIVELPSLLKDSRKRWRLVIPGIALLALAGGLAYYAAFYLPAHAAKLETLQTTAARRGDITLSAGGTGTLHAANQRDLAFKTSGKLTNLYVKVGDHVTEGQFLAELDNTSQQPQYDRQERTMKA